MCALADVKLYCFPCLKTSPLFWLPFVVAGIPNSVSAFQMNMWRKYTPWLRTQLQFPNLIKYSSSLFSESSMGARRSNLEVISSCDSEPLSLDWKVLLSFWMYFMQFSDEGEHNICQSLSFVRFVRFFAFANQRPGVTSDNLGVTSDYLEDTSDYLAPTKMFKFLTWQGSGQVVRPLLGLRMLPALL